MENQFPDESFFSGQKRYFLEEDDHMMGKRSRVDQYLEPTLLQPEIPNRYTQDPLYRGAPFSAFARPMTSQSNMIPTLQTTSYPSFYFPTIPTGPPGSSFLPFSTSQTRDSGLDPSLEVERNSLLLQQPQVYYFSSPPYLPPSRGPSYSQITTLQSPMQGNQISSPLTQLLPTSLSEQELEETSGFQFGLSSGMSGGLNALASAASGSVVQHILPEKPKRKNNAKTEGLKRKEGLEESSLKIISLLQKKGKMIFKDIHETLAIDYRRAYDILNILQTTALIVRTGKKRENKMPYVYQDGSCLEDPVDLRDLLDDLKQEEETNRIMQQRVNILERELAKGVPIILPRVLTQLLAVDLSVRENSLYKEMFQYET